MCVVRFDIGEGRDWTFYCRLHVTEWIRWHMNALWMSNVGAWTEELGIETWM